MKHGKTVDADLIMSFGPCVDWPKSRIREVVPKRFSLIEFLRNTAIPARVRLWVALEGVFLTDRIMRLFACDCAERTLMRERERGRHSDPSRDPDLESWNAIEVSRRYAVGDATEEELYAAREAALGVVQDIKRASPWVIKRASAWIDAWFWSLHAAWATTQPSAQISAWNAACDAVLAAALDAKGEEYEWQCAHIAEMLEAI